MSSLPTQDIETTSFLHQNGQHKPFNNIRVAPIGKMTMIYDDFTPVFERALAL
jgi:hypothetical protein